MRLSELDYHLPKELIAQKPAKPRDRSRLLVLDRKTGKIKHRRFSNIVDYLNKGDILVLNNTRVIPCRVIGERQSGGLADILLCQNDQKDKSVWTALINFNRRLKENETLTLTNNKSVKVTLLKRLASGWQIKITPAIEIKDLQTFGKMPLPPYIKRPKTGDRQIKSDKDCYQTVYADKDGSIAAPTAGLHFTRPLINRLIKKGVRIVYITLHVGIGTFKPIKADNIEDHQMEQEYFEVSPETTRVLLEAYRDKKKVIAVGTTVCRVLETISGQIRMLMIHPWLENQRVMRASLIRGWTDLFIRPPYQFNIVQSLVTNFHLPHGTPLALAAAFAGRDRIMDAYRIAITKKYRFYSYGDAMVII
ncbi:MAG TPA: tRNA preQ1(34) S-adenosylmethionine ribosyltransferase-isomerase QueA [Planctomycetota bacterium]|nr:tRNA preQ1(34) S-adenosylmethionine ribosyltransferase-isomerase QueA [Planctomycetota bacterium]